MNKMRFGRDGKNERTETNWKKMEREPAAQLRENFGSERMEKMVSVAQLKEYLLVNMIEQEQLLCITKNGVVCSKCWTRQTLNDASWDATNWDGLCDTPWQMVAPELKLTKKSEESLDSRPSSERWTFLCGR